METDPTNIQALEVLGDIEDSLEQFEAAAEAFGRAVRCRSRDKRLRLKQAAALFKADRYPEAVEAYKSAIAMGASTAKVFAELGMALARAGNGEEAIVVLRHAVASDPTNLLPRKVLAEQLTEAGATDEAITAYREAAELAPDDPDIRYNQARLLFKSNQDAKALAEVEQAIRLRPGMHAAHALQSALLWRHGRFEAAERAARSALAILPGDPVALTNLGNALESIGRLGEALEIRKLAVARDASCANHTNLGIAQCALGDAAAGVASLEKAVAIDPAEPVAQFNLALAHIREGRFDLGWKGYAWRFRAKPVDWRPRYTDLARWRGGPIGHRRLLVWGEQGIGDEIMFAGLVPRLGETQERRALECDPRLAPLFARSFPDVVVLPRAGAGQLPDDVGAQVAAGDLPGILRPDLGPAPWLPPGYLRPDAMLRDQLRTRYGAGRPLVGIAWRTSNLASGRRRSLDRAALARLLAALDVQWVSLQYGEPAALSQETQGMAIVDETIDQRADLDAFAAQIATMDAVVTIDNSTAHIAGALGRPTLLLLPFAADWRWLRDRSDSPWYPSLRLLRQSRPGDWDGVLAKVPGQIARLGDWDALPTQGAS